MCLIAFAIGLVPEQPLLLAANRDEFFERPTAPLDRWSLDGGITVLAGRDLRDGGTWLGIGDNGRVAMLTNVRSANPGPGPRSRGELPTRWLNGEASVDRWLGEIDPGDYGGFNLVVGDLRSGQWTWIANRDPGQPHDDARVTLHHQTLAPGIYGLSNAALDTPWAKTQRLKQAVRSALDSPLGRLDALAQALSDPTRQPADALPHTGVPVEAEQALSSAFVDMGERGYGTRSSLVMDVSKEGDGHAGWRAQLTEWTHTPRPGRAHRWTSRSPLAFQMTGHGA